jgi:bifunctional polynucleotide phosphatase/kinase
LCSHTSYRVVILTNQGGLELHPDPNSKAPKKNSTERISNFKQKCSAVLSQLDIPLTLYAATGKDIFRKPRTGMWKELCKDYDLDESSIDFGSSVFVGDAGGRKAHLIGGKAIPKDFSCSDRNLAHNIGLTFKTPEEFFLGESPRDFARGFDLTDFPFSGKYDEAFKFEKKNDQELVLFCGPPGAGKSTFFWKHLKPLGFERVNQDILKRYAPGATDCIMLGYSPLMQQRQVLQGCHRPVTGRRVRGDRYRESCSRSSTALWHLLTYTDATNPDPDTRAQWIALANKHKVPIRCVWFRTPLQLCEHNDVVRSLNKDVCLATNLHVG